MKKKDILDKPLTRWPKKLTTTVSYVKSVINNNEIQISLVKGTGFNPSTISVSDNQNFALIKNSIYRVTQDNRLIVTPYLVMGATDARHFSGLSDSIYRLIV